MKRIDTGGYYCSDCGYTASVLPVGMVTCRSCGHLGLRAYDRKPRRVRCEEEGCGFVGWDDGGVNNDMGRHKRRDHAKAEKG